MVGSQRWPIEFENRLRIALTGIPIRKTQQHKVYVFDERFSACSLHTTQELPTPNSFQVNVPLALP